MFNFDEPFGHCIFCDDIRQEVGGKVSYMGAYYGALFVPSFPFITSRFAVAVTFYEPREMALRRTWNVPVRVSIPGNDDAFPSGEIPVVTEEAINGQLKSNLPDDPDVPKLVIYQFAFAVAPLTFNAPGRLKVRAFYSDDMIVKLGSLRIEQQSRDSNVVANTS